MFGNIGIWQLLIVLVIVLLLFGTKRLKGLGGDLGGAIKGFKKAISDDKSGTTPEDDSHEDKKAVADEKIETPVTGDKTQQASPEKKQ